MNSIRLKIKPPECLLRVLGNSSFTEIEGRREWPKYASPKSVRKNNKKKPFEIQALIEFIKLMHPRI